MGVVLRGWVVGDYFSTEAMRAEAMKGPAFGGL
jgi:hypothetical protein